MKEHLASPPSKPRDDRAACAEYHTASHGQLVRHLDAHHLYFLTFNRYMLLRWPLVQFMLSGPSCGKNNTVCLVTESTWCQC